MELYLGVQKYSKDSIVINVSVGLAYKYKDVKESSGSLVDTTPIDFIGLLYWNNWIAGITLIKRNTRLKRFQNNLDMPLGVK